MTVELISHNPLFRIDGNPGNPARSFAMAFPVRLPGVASIETILARPKPASAKRPEIEWRVIREVTNGR
ncbi:hypothetical protein O7A70_33150 [Mesorhizobium sp. Cs1299R1N1]|uniref:hypothetical protein n=1 Tax=Mesorhizobium sp. Cs1299R1N1 TaxID=3015172 RepID=UPI00301C4620